MKPRPVEGVSVGLMLDPGPVAAQQVVITLAEMLTMRTMPGGISFANWLRLHGLLEEETKES